jgi:glc operon protein GlcG
MTEGFMNTVTRALPVASILAERRSWMILLGVLSATVMAHGQTSKFQTISLDGARTLLHAAEQKAQQLSAPSSLAVVDAAGDLILFEQMEGARRIGIDLAIGKARSAARFQEATQTLEAAINGGRPAAITAGAIQMDGGVPIRIGGGVVGAVGVSGLDHHNDIEIAEAAAAAVTQELAR